MKRLCVSIIFVISEPIEVTQLLILHRLYKCFIANKLQIQSNAVLLLKANLTR